VTTTITYSGLLEVERAFERAIAEAPAEAGKVVKKAAVNISKDWEQRWEGMAHLPRLPRSIGFDMHLSFRNGPWAEIGPDNQKVQGNLAHLIEIEYGSARNAPRPGGAPAAAAEEPRFVAAIEELAARLLGER